MKGDCLSCSKINRCMETSIERVLQDYTCVMYEPVPEPIYKARVHLMEKFGDELAVKAMLGRPAQQEGEEQ